MRMRASVAGELRQHGVALVVALLLLLVLTMLALSGMTSAALELLLSGNVQYQEQAFQAAEAGIEQALAAGGFEDGTGIGSYDDLAAADPLPIRGTGAPIAGCQEGPAADTRQCGSSCATTPCTAATPVPPAGRHASTRVVSGLAAYHFVIDSVRRIGPRAAEDTHAQGFYVLAGSVPAAPRCPLRRAHRSVRIGASGGAD